MVTKLARVMTFDEGNSSIMSDDPLIMWSRDVRWQIEKSISPLPRGLWPPNMEGWWLIMGGTQLWSHMILWHCGDVWWCDKLQVWHIFSWKAYDHEAWQVGDLPRAERTHEAIYPLTTRSLEVTWQTKKIFFVLQKPYGHQTLQGADIRWHKAHNKIARLWSRDRKRSRVKLKTYTSSSIRPPPDLVGWWHMEPPMEPHDSFIMQLCEVTWKI